LFADATLIMLVIHKLLNTAKAGKQKIMQDVVKNLIGF
jgi:hypothetical protein